MASERNFYVGVFLITSCTLMLQLIQTRILSVVAWYHLAFFVISMAMFGLTAGAVWVYLRKDRFSGKTLSYDLSYYSAAFAVATVLSLAVQMTLVPVATKALTSILTWVELGIVISIPFFFSGIVVSLALTRSPFPIGRVYGVDLLGAAVGSLGVILILNNTDGPSAVLWAASIAAAGSLFFSKSNVGGEPDERLPLDSFLRRRKSILLAIVVFAILNGSTVLGLQPLVVKGKFENAYTHLFREWNTFSRVVVREEAKNVTPAMWGPSKRFKGFKVDQRVMDVDGDAGSTMYRFSGDMQEVEFLKFDVTNLAYFLPGRQKGAVIGVGGGRDMLSAALFGLQDITGVEINPIFVKLLQGEAEFSDLLIKRETDFSGFNKLAELPSTKFVVDEGRSWFARSKDTFDIIQMSLIDTWAATGAGAFTLSENGLYTVQAMKIFLSRLSQNGIFTVSRWYNPNMPKEAGRMLSLSVAALFEMGIQEPRRHIFIATEGRIANLLISREPFSIRDLKVLDETVEEYGYEVLVKPTREPESEVLRNIVMADSREELVRYTSGLELDLTPPTDDRPFFFNQFPFNKPVEAVKLFKEMYGRGGYGGVYEGNLVATGTLIILFFVSLGLVLATIIIPLRSAIKDVGGKLVTGGTIYFMLIGIGFMMTEIGLLQRTSVFLGHPMYSLSVLLFTLILTAGIGSLLSEKFLLDTQAKFTSWALLTGVYILLLPLWVPDVFLAYDSAEFLVRAAICIIAIAPAGLLMGFGFPTGMRMISSLDRKPTPWFWGINGAAGVMASVVAIASSIGFGISTTLSIGALSYLLLIPVTMLFMSSAFQGLRTFSNAARQGERSEGA